MAAGDNLNTCPVCNASNMFVGMRRVEGRRLIDIFPCEIFWIQCTKCGFDGRASETREGALREWNTTTRISRI